MTGSSTSLTGFILTGCAFALFIIITLSTPINKQLALVHINGANVTADLGVFGACYTPEGGNMTCSPTSVGYTLSTTYLSALSVADVHRPALTRLTRGLVANPLAAGLGGLAFIMSLLATFVPNVALVVAAFGLVVLSVIAGSVAFGINLALVLIVKSRVKRATAGAYSSTIGTSLWLSVAALAATLLALIFAVAACCRSRRIPRTGGYTRASVHAQDGKDGTELGRDRSHSQELSHSQSPDRNVDVDVEAKGEGKGGEKAQGEGKDGDSSVKVRPAYHSTY